MITINHIKDFNIDHIFDCGQCFRWTRETNGSYTGVAFGKIVNIKAKPVSKGFVDLEIENATQEEFENIWRHYLDLERDYGPIKAYLSNEDPVMQRAIAYGYGIRILNQDKWEAIISFLISQNNNIPRIKKCIESLCEGFGEYLGEWDGKKYYDIPKPEILAKLTEEDLAACRLGYRGKYILETARQVEKQGLVETFEYLNTLCGVGPKVANCVLLFSMKKIECFPIDVWVKRVMNQLYGIDEEDTKGMLAYSEKNFGGYGGIAQQYLFYYIREGQK